jgi:hypothetical protein
MTIEKIYVSVDSEKVELTGKALEDYLAQRELDLIADKERENKQAEQSVAKAALLNRLGITAEEAALLLA